MATVFENVQFSVLTDSNNFKPKFDSDVTLRINKDDYCIEIEVFQAEEVLQTVKIKKDAETARVGEKAVVVATEESSLLLKFLSNADQNSFLHRLKEAIKHRKDSVFNERTDASSAEQYFQFYGYLSQQQNMMQDYVRTSTYQRAMLDNTTDFNDKVVLDVGAGSGILSFFAIQAGAKKVYAIEASSMAIQCERLVNSNKLGNKIQVISGKIEEIDLPEKVDIIISEPMGYMLFNERMLETYLHAKKWLKPGGLMFPTRGDLHIAPFTDDALYMEQFSKANFWYQPSFHGVDLSHLRDAAVQEYFKQPIVDTFDMRICLAKSVKYTVDFETAHESDLHDMDIPLSFTMLQSGTIHGLAFWFDVAFIGTQNTVWLSTSPTQPLTHWYQVRCLIQEPIFAKQGQVVNGKVQLRANKRQSYDVDIVLQVENTTIKSANSLDLKNPFFRYTGQQPQPPPGTNNTSPSDNYWNITPEQAVCIDPSVVQQATNQVNAYGMLNGGLGDTQIIIQQQPQQLVQTQQVQLQQVQQQQLASPPAGQNSNLVPLANLAPVNPGSIPAATIVSLGNAANQALQTRTSIGAGISPNAFQNGVTPHFTVSQQFMIGDYAVPGNLTVPGQQALENAVQFKS